MAGAVLSTDSLHHLSHLDEQLRMITPDPRRARPSAPIRQTRHSAIVAVLVASVACGGLIAFASNDDDGGTAAAGPDSVPAVIDDGAPDETVASTPVDASASSVAATTDSAVPDLVGDEAATAVSDDGGCLITVQSVRFGATGSSVTCLQEALITDGYMSGAANGTFDQATDTAVRAMQQDRDLFVDGVVGRESAISLGIWPDEASLVIHTPAPAAGAMDSMGYPLSSVASTGAGAPPLPDGSGSGRRVVYDRAGQRVWAVSADGEIIRSWLVSGSKYSNELAGTHEVYSRSDRSTAWNGKAWLPQMIRWLKTDIGAIGFHAIPLHVEDNSPYQTEAELGTRLSGGCQRQANRDAAFLWDFAQVGTKVVVV